MAEGAGLFVSSVVTYTLLLWEYGLLSYALGTLSYVVALNVVYMFSIDLRRGTPSTVTKEQTDLVREYSQSCILKFCLTQGENFILIA